MATTSTSTAAPGGGGGRAASSSREGSAKAMVADQISQAVQSTSNLLHLMQQSSPSQAQLIKLPKNLLAKTSTIKNTGLVLEQMPRVISSLDAHMENGLQSHVKLEPVMPTLLLMKTYMVVCCAWREFFESDVPHLKTVIQLLANIESCQLKSLSKAPLSQEASGTKTRRPTIRGCLNNKSSLCSHFAVGMEAAG
ncbi:unnamed protein product [Camellia sinensis]